MLRFSATRLLNILYDIKCSLLNVRKLKFWSGIVHAVQFMIRSISHLVYMVYAYQFKGQLRVILPTLKSFNSLHTVCFMYELSIYGIKRICHRARFFIISHGSFQHFATFSEKNDVLIIKLK